LVMMKLHFGMVYGGVNEYAVWKEGMMVQMT
jgi:hypothetical protein